MKGDGQEGLMSPDEIRALIAKGTPTQKAASTMRPSDYIPGTTLRTTSALRKSAPLRKAAKKPSLVAVYDSTGKLVGTVDPAKITVLTSAEDPNTPKAPAAPKPKASVSPSTAPEANPAPQIPEDATDGPAAGRSAPTPAPVPTEAMDTVAKALAGAGFRDGARPFAPAAGRSVDDRYVNLVKSVDVRHRDALGDAVAHAAMTFQFSSRIAGAEAVRLAKSIALDLAAVEVRKPKPSIEAATAAMKRARPLR